MALHPRTHGKHAIGWSEFLHLVRTQLAADLDHDCKPLGLQGARGALFKIGLVSHGYVFVGKGTVKVFVPDLLHEGAIYQRLGRLQGTAVPVCLGNIDLVEKYYLDVGVRIRHMLLMAWGGDTIGDEMDRSEIRRTTREVKCAGVDQGDVRSANLLWNEENGRVMLIDFERAVCIEGYKREAVAKVESPLQEISPNRRRKRESIVEGRGEDMASTVIGMPLEPQACDRIFKVGAGFL